VNSNVLACSASASKNFTFNVEKMPAKVDPKRTDSGRENSIEFAN